MLKQLLYMNLEIFKESDPSGRMSKESYLFKNHTEEYKYIIDYCEFNKIFDIPFKEKVYLCLNSLKKVPTCKNPNCNKKVKFKNSTIGYYDYCCNKCVSSDINIKKIKEEKSFEKYGTKSPAQSKEIKEKIIQTNQKLYGGNSPMCLKEIQEKSKNTLMKNYGVDNPSKSPVLLKSRIASFKLSNYKESFKATSILKYGVKHPWMNKDIYKKTTDSSKISRNNLTRKCILNMISNYKLINVDFETGDALIECDKGHQFVSTRNFIYNRFRIKSEICTVCNPIMDQKSGSEISLVKFIHKIYNGKILENDRNIIKPFEIDIYLPDIKIGFEFNGLWWDSSEYRDYNYHFFKQNRVATQDIKLFTIWEDEWVYSNDAVKSFIMNKLHKTENKLYARKCKVEITNRELSNDFFDLNHLSGGCNSSIRLCLKYNDEIVSMIAFSKMSDGGWELDRFCNKNKTQIVGGFSKILKFFIKSYKPKYIVTYSDNMKSDGDVYKRNNFLLIEEQSPSYTLLISKKRQHRLYGKDGKKYPKIYNAGNKKWILNFY